MRNITPLKAPCAPRGHSCYRDRRCRVLRPLRPKPCSSQWPRRLQRWHPRLRNASQFLRVVCSGSRCRRSRRPRAPMRATRSRRYSTSCTVVSSTAIIGEIMSQDSPFYVLERNWIDVLVEEESNYITGQHDRFEEVSGKTHCPPSRTSESFPWLGYCKAESLRSS